MAALEEMFVYTAVDGDGAETICGILDPDSKRWTPLIATSRDVADQLKPVAIHLAETSGTTVSLVRFAARTVLDEFDP